MDFLKKKQDGPPKPVYVVFGDEELLRREAANKIRTSVVGPEPDDFTYSLYQGDSAKLANVLDDLHTPPFLGERRLVNVENAEEFISKHRDSLLAYVNQPASCGVLLLQPRSWRSNTKLYQAVEKVGLAVDAAGPKAWHVGAWSTQWSERIYGKTLTKSAADWLVELVGTDLGQLDQELGKLSSFVGDRAAIELDDINRLVAGTRTENTFKLLELALGGEIGKAVEMLDRQLVAGDSPIMIVAVLTSQLRKLTQAARAVVAGASMDSALHDAGIPPFALQKSREQLRSIGRDRMLGMYRKLLDLDLQLKGGSALSERTVLERFLIELARPARAPVATASSR